MVTLNRSKNSTTQELAMVCYYWKHTIEFQKIIGSFRNLNALSMNINELGEDVRIPANQIATFAVGEFLDKSLMQMIFRSSLVMGGAESTSFSPFLEQRSI